MPFNKKFVPCALADCCNYMHHEVIWGIGILHFKVFATSKFTLLLYTKVELSHFFSYQDE